MDDSVNVGGIILAIVLVIVGLFFLGWLVQGNDYFMFKVFAPKMEQVRRETFEQSKAYNQGMAQDLESMRQDYIMNKDKEVRAGLRSVIFHKLADYDTSKLTPDLREWIQQLHNDEKEAEAQ